MQERTPDTPWRQGMLLSLEAIQSNNLLHKRNPDTTVAIVISHDCDIAQSPDKEPFIEVIVGNRIDRLDGNKTHAKSPRTLHLQFSGPKQFFAEFTITDKSSLPKKKLMRFRPIYDSILSQESLNTLQLWLASRYRRAAFPDEFNKRMRRHRLDERITKLLKKYSNKVSALFFDIDAGEMIERVTSDEPYLLNIYILYPTEIPDAATTAGELQTTLETTFRETLFDKNSGSWQDIELGHMGTISEEGLSYRQAKSMKQWRLEYLSLKEEPQQPFFADH